MAPRLFLLLALSLITSLSSIPHLKYRPTSHHAAVWEQMYAKVPAIWKAKKDLQIREFYTDSWDAFLKREVGALPIEGRIIGIYVPSRREITMPEDLDQSECGRTFLHEYGHYLWFEQSTTKQRHDFERIWKSHQAFAASYYSTVSVEEGWSEYFSYYISDPQYLKDIDISMFAFFRSVETGQR